jgi:hypothetical protein
VRPPTMIQTLTVAVDPLVVDALQSVDDVDRETAWSELTLVAASAMAEIHAGLHRWMTGRLVSAPTTPALSSAMRSASSSPSTRQSRSR